MITHHVCHFAILGDDILTFWHRRCKPLLLLLPLLTFIFHHYGLGCLRLHGRRVSHDWGWVKRRMHLGREGKGKENCQQVIFLVIESRNHRLRLKQKFLDASMHLSMRVFPSLGPNQFFQLRNSSQNDWILTWKSRNVFEVFPRLHDHVLFLQQPANNRRTTCNVQTTCQTDSLSVILSSFPLLNASLFEQTCFFKDKMDFPWSPTKWAEKEFMGKGKWKEEEKSGCLAKDSIPILWPV